MGLTAEQRDETMTGRPSDTEPLKYSTHRLYAGQHGMKDHLRPNVKMGAVATGMHLMRPSLPGPPASRNLQLT